MEVTIEETPWFLACGSRWDRVLLPEMGSREEGHCGETSESSRTTCGVGEARAMTGCRCEVGAHRTQESGA